MKWIYFQRSHCPICVYCQSDVEQKLAWILFTQIYRFSIEFQNRTQKKYDYKMNDFFGVPPKLYSRGITNLKNSIFTLIRSVSLIKSFTKHWTVAVNPKSNLCNPKLNMHDYQIQIKRFNVRISVRMSTTS